MHVHLRDRRGTEEGHFERTTAGSRQTTVGMPALDREHQRPSGRGDQKARGTPSVCGVQIDVSVAALLCITDIPLQVQHVAGSLSSLPCLLLSLLLPPRWFEVADRSDGWGSSWRGLSNHPSVSGSSARVARDGPTVGLNLKLDSRGRISGRTPGSRAENRPRPRV